MACNSIHFNPCKTSTELAYLINSEVLGVVLVRIHRGILCTVIQFSHEGQYLLKVLHEVAVEGM